MLRKQNITAGKLFKLDNDTDEDATGAVAAVAGASMGLLNAAKGEAHPEIDVDS